LAKIQTRGHPLECSIHERERILRELSQGDAGAVLADKLRRAASGVAERMEELLDEEWSVISMKGGSRRSALYVDRLAMTRALYRRARSSISDLELWSLAFTDELTGLFNRRGFLFLASQQLKLASRNGCDSLLFYCDLDEFKSINDRYGHEVGDEALRRTARAMKRTFRKSDIVGRFGGDEFVALALETKRQDNMSIEQRLRRNLRAANGPESRYQLSLSIGLAKNFPGTTASLRDLLARADRNLYAAKIREPEKESSRGASA
jgi:diguanylate cyclase (GGDEF)-like protein